MIFTQHNHNNSKINKMRSKEKKNRKNRIAQEISSNEKHTLKLHAQFAAKEKKNRMRKCFYRKCSLRSE